MYPKFMYHESKDAIQVGSAEAEADARSQGYREHYIHREYPKHMYREVEGDDSQLEVVEVGSPEAEAEAAEQGFREDIDPKHPLASDSRFHH